MHGGAHNQNEPPRKRVWPRLLLAGVILFFAVSTLWLLLLVERVKRIRTSTQEAAPVTTNATPPPR